MYGSDQSASLEKNGCRSLVEQIRKVEICLGDGEKLFLKKNTYSRKTKTAY